jgi:hypothetical protein
LLDGVPEGPMDDRLREARNLLDRVRHLAAARHAGEEERRDAFGRLALLRRIQREYEEMPGMSLTAPQARRLFALPEDVCSRMFDELVGRGVLRRKRDGRYVFNVSAA